MSFRAKWPTECMNCDDGIHVNQEVEFDDDRNLQHVICPEDLGLGGKPRPVCPHCFCVIPTSGVCDCRE